MVLVKTKPKARPKAKQTRVKPPQGEIKAAESVVVTMLVDESGSMMSVWESTMSGFNEYVDTLKKDMADERAYFSAIKFDTRGVRKLQVGAALTDAIHLSQQNYQPSGGTPLLDAVGKTLLATDEVVKQQSGTKVIVVIQTDGAENSSVEFKLHDIKRMVEERQGRGWQIMFMGAGINAFHDGISMGIAAGSTISYGKTDHNTRATFVAAASNSSGFAHGIIRNTNFSAAQSMAAGEAPNITLQKMEKSGTASPPPTTPPTTPPTSTPISSLSLSS